MRDQIAEAATQLWFALHRLSSYALLNLLDEPAILAMAFC
jgi:hypothetical protein